MRVDRYFRVFRNNLYPFIDVKQEQEDLTELVEIGDEPFILHPGEFVLGSTLERVRLPGRSRRPARGEVEPGAARPADPLDRRLHRPGLGRARDARALERRQPADHDLPGMKIGQISFMQMTEPAATPYGADGARLEVPGPARADAEPLLEELRGGRVTVLRHRRRRASSGRRSSTRCARRDATCARSSRDPERAARARAPGASSSPRATSPTRPRLARRGGRLRRRRPPRRDHPRRPRRLRARDGRRARGNVVAAAQRGGRRAGSC